jgi:hypothetical protein
VSVYNWADNATAGIRGGTGEVWGVTKSFLVPHPQNDELMIRYTSLEGPTPDIYMRGSVMLEAGRASVDLPEHFAALVNPEDLTITLTPRSVDSLGVAVSAADQNGFEIAELYQGMGDYRVDFVVFGLRAGYEDYPVYLSKHEPASKAAPQSYALSSEQGVQEIEVSGSFADYRGESDGLRHSLSKPR